MKIKSKACGDYGTNCYIVEINQKELIIDPGMDAAMWVLQEVRHPVAILNTHGHFDHVWSNAELKEIITKGFFCKYSYHGRIDTATNT